ncbi:hypothetical protein CDD82_2512 [Ophiocordyceps australis]|uniref:GCN5-related N-acetyltransferase Rv2170-like domain-containing protein n=1 Tax=Ophiocordyceps australis TaxID=1399860 RepID=A0A2C5XWF5_9HYPO|nr:hypothetical protein CDD82_2512 [Ophiocordyceps australis]
MQIRTATYQDVPAMASLVLAALANEHPWSTLVSPRLAAQAQSVAYATDLLASLIHDASVLVVVLELSDAAKPSHQGPLLVSVSVWDLAYLSSSRPSSCYTAAVSAAKFSSPTCHGLVSLATTYLAGNMHRLPQLHLFLALVATRPEFGRRGFGKMLVVRALEIALAHTKLRQVSVGVLAGPTAYVLFSGLGFRDMDAVDFPGDAASADSSINHGSYLKTMVLDSGRKRLSKERRPDWSLLRRLVNAWT